MSKTVKRVITVTMIGVVAMLGVTAEAHYVVIRGRCYWHSHECSRQDTDVRDPVPILLTGEVISTTNRVELLCPGGNVEGEPVTLTARKPIVPSDTTRVTNSQGQISRNAEWTVIVSDGYFLASTFCPGSVPPVPPQDVIIREMSVKMNLYCSSRTDRECSGTPGAPHSTWEATCTLPGGFNFSNLPARGTRYDCKETRRCHGVECGKP